MHNGRMIGTDFLYEFCNALMRSVLNVTLTLSLTNQIVIWSCSECFPKILVTGKSDAHEKQFSKNLVTYFFIYCPIQINLSISDVKEKSGQFCNDLP